MKLGIKTAVAVLLLFVLCRLGSIDHSLIAAVFRSPATLAISLACLFAGILLSGIRWWVLLSMSGHTLSVLECLRLQLLGSFFTTYLPGAAGGDLVRGAYIFKMVGRNEGRTSAIFSIVVDRIFSLLGLILIGGFASAYIFWAKARADGIEVYMRLSILFALVSILGLTVVVGVVIAIPNSRAFQFLPTRIQSYFEIVGATTKTYATRWASVALCGVISVTASGIVIIGIVSIGITFPYPPNPMILAVAGVFGNVFSAIPIAPGGLGVGESIFTTVCQELTKTTAPFATIYLTFRILMFIVNIPGGILAVVDRLTRRVTENAGE